MWHALFQAPAVNCGQDTVPSFMACNLLGKQTLVKEICEIRQGTGFAAGIKMLFGLLLCMFQCLDPSLGCDDSSFLLPCTLGGGGADPTSWIPVSHAGCQD